MNITVSITTDAGSTEVSRDYPEIRVMQLPPEPPYGKVAADTLREIADQIEAMDTRGGDDA